MLEIYACQKYMHIRNIYACQKYIHVFQKFMLVRDTLNESQKTVHIFKEMYACQKYVSACQKYMHVFSETLDN